MSLLVETLILASGISFFTALPLIFINIKNYSKYLFLIGTGAMVGICFFDLLPDVFELGGYSSLGIIGIVAVFYSAIHIFHSHPEHNHVNTASHSIKSSRALLVFLGSLMAHCFASGMLLAISHALSQKVASTVFLALAAHKGYEAMMLSSILLEQACSKAKKIGLMVLYVFSFPAGVLVTYLFKESFDQEVAVLISSVAVGTLMGCLVFDFLIPSLKQLKTKRLQVLWIVGGLFLTQIIMKGG